MPSIFINQDALNKMQNTQPEALWNTIRMVSPGLYQINVDQPSVAKVQTLAGVPPTLQANAPTVSAAIAGAILTGTYTKLKFLPERD